MLPLLHVALPLNCCRLCRHRFELPLPLLPLGSLLPPLSLLSAAGLLPIHVRSVLDQALSGLTAVTRARHGGLLAGGGGSTRGFQAAALLRGKLNPATLNKRA